MFTSYAYYTSGAASLLSLIFRVQLTCFCDTEEASDSLLLLYHCLLLLLTCFWDATSLANVILVP